MSIRTARYQGEALAEALGFKKPPVNVEQVAKSLGLKVVRVDLGDDISGLLISKGDSTTIAVQESDPPKRQRFTIAHEIAHFHLRHQFEPGEHVHVDRRLAEIHDRYGSGHLVSRSIRRATPNPNYDLSVTKDRHIKRTLVHFV